MKILGLEKQLRKKIIVILVLATLGPLTLWGLFLYLNSLRGQEVFFERQLQQSAQILDLQAQKWNESNRLILTVMAKELSFHERSEWRKILLNVAESAPQLFVAQILDQNGNNVERSDDKPFRKNSDRNWVREGLQGRMYSEALFSSRYLRPALCTGAPVIRDNEIKYVAGLCTFLEDLTNSVGTLNIGKSGFTFLLDDRGRVIAHPELAFLQDARNETEKTLIEFAHSHPTGRYEVDVAGESYLVFVNQGSNGWRSAAFQSKSEIMALSRQRLSWPFATSVLILVLVLALTIWMIDDLTLPLRQLTKTVRKFAQGDLEARASVGSKDEVGVLASSFNQMATQIKATIEELQRKENQLVHQSQELHHLVQDQSQKLVYSAKMSSLGEMAGSIAHEINNPLTIIGIKIQQLRSLLASEQLNALQLRKSLEQIEATSLRIHRIIKGLRAFSRDGSLDPMMDERLLPILLETQGLCSEFLRSKGVRLEIDCPTHLHLECQQVQISQVILNLMMNSLSAISDLDEKWIRIVAKDWDDQILIEFTDSGSGIPEPTRSRMMQPFFTTKKIGEGTGLGLSISKGIIESHQGDFTFNSDSPHTQFLILLPKKQKPVSDSHERNRFVLEPKVQTVPQVEALDHSRSQVLLQVVRSDESFGATNPSQEKLQRGF